MLNKKLFVVCTKEGGYIKECVQKIIAHYPEDDILVVDSDSKDKSYMDGLRKYKNVVIADYKNKNYEYGAIRYGFLNNKNKYDVFFFIQDSMKIEGEIDLSILDEDSVLFFSLRKTGWKYCRKLENISKNKFPDFFNHPKYVSADNLLLTQYNSFIINSSTFEKCLNSEIFSLIDAPTNKIESCIWERIWSSIFIANGLKRKVIKNLSNITKIYGKRK